MMTKLREYSKIFIIIVALAFIALMVFEWGMDITGIRSKQHSVGKVNDKELSYEMFSELYQRMYQNEKTRLERELNENETENLRTQVWEQFVQSTLFQEEMEKLAITATDSEVVYQIRHFPLEQIKNNPSFQTNGVFDWNKYYSSFGNPEIPWLQVEDYYRQQLPYQKLQNIISSTVRVSDSEISDEYFNTNQKVKISYLEIPISKFNDAKSPVSDDEAINYYKENISDIQQKEKRRLDYIIFPLVPSRNDTLRIYDEFSDMKERIKNGEDFNAMAEEFSEDPAVKTNKGRYEFFERGAMLKPFEDASFAGKIGEIVGPIETQFGLHLIKIEDKRIEKGKEQVKVSHILLKIVAGPSTREKQESAAAYFVDDARTEGFEVVAKRDSLKIEKTNLISIESNFIPGFGKNYQIFNFAFKNDLNAISEMINTENGYAIFKLTEIIPEGPQPFEEIKYMIESKVRLENAKNKARKFATQIEDKIKNQFSFNSIASDDTAGVVRYDSTEFFTLKSSIPKIGFDNIFNATAFSLDIGQTSDMIETNRGLYWQNLIEKTEFDSTNFKSQYNQIHQRILARKKNQAFNDWYEYLKKQAEIEDNRNLFNL